MSESIDRRAFLAGAGAYGLALATSSGAGAVARARKYAYGGGASRLGSTHARTRPYVSGMAYQNYIDSSLRGWQKAY